MSRRLPAGFVYVASEAIGGFLFEMVVVVFAVYLIRDVHLQPLQLVLMGTALEATYFLFEVPTGVVADVVSRRASIVIGMFLSGIAFFLLGIVHTFVAALLTQVLWGFGATFHSGADVAWITDEVGEEPARALYLRSAQAANLGGLLGIVVGVLLATIDLSLPIKLAGIGFLVLGGAMIVVMPEEGFRRPPAGERMRHSFRETVGSSIRTVRMHHVLLLILAIAAIHGFSTEGFDQLADYHLLRDIGLPSFGGFNRILWFGVIDGGSLLLGVAATEIVRRKVDLDHMHGAARTLLVIDLLLAALVVAFALVGGFTLALCAFWLVAGLRSVREPLFNAWINRGIDPKVRATVNSIGAQADAIGQVAGGSLGLIAKATSAATAIVVSGLARLPTLALYGLAIKRGREGALDASEVADLAEKPAP